MLHTNLTFLREKTRSLRNRLEGGPAPDEVGHYTNKSRTGHYEAAAGQTLQHFESTPYPFSGYIGGLERYESGEEFLRLMDFYEMVIAALIIVIVILILRK